MQGKGRQPSTANSLEKNITFLMSLTLAGEGRKLT